MQIIEPLESGNYYHIYNRGNNSETIFKENRNNEHFLNLYNTHINPIADTYAWCLMKNHFHLLVRIKTIEEIIQAQEAQEPTETKKSLHHINLLATYLMPIPKQ